MFILSNNKILAVFAMVACFASLANADQVRRRTLRGSDKGLEGEAELQEVDHQRNLKKDKKGKNKKGLLGQSYSKPIGGTNVDASSNNFFFSRPIVPAKGAITVFEEKCAEPRKIDALNSCVPFNQMEACKKCLIGKQSLNIVPGSSSLQSCFRAQIPGFCTASCADQAKDYFGCGTGRPDFGVTTPATPVVIAVTPAVTTPVVTTPVITPVVTTPVTNPVTTPVTGGTTTTTSDSGMTTTAVTATASSVGEMAPVNICPTENPGSGTTCDLQGYNVMECWYPGNEMCTCGYLSPIFLCNEY